MSILRRDGEQLQCGTGTSGSERAGRWLGGGWDGIFNVCIVTVFLATDRSSLALSATLYIDRSGNDLFLVKPA